MSTDNVRHIVSLSGGKDSTALAIYLRSRRPDIAFEYAFSDTDKELPETYEYLDKLEAYLGQAIVRLRDERGFDFWLHQYGGYLPSSRMRWCTRQLKIKPFEKFIGDDVCRMYIGIRADEQRGGYRPTKPNITPVYPLIEAGFTLDDVHRILEESGISFPNYYSWRTRSGCYFCFYQRKREWLGLREHHPELFKDAKKYEKADPVTGKRYTWSERESLDELEDPARVAEIQRKHAEEVDRAKKRNVSLPLLQVLGDMDDADGDSLPCSFCQV